MAASECDTFLSESEKIALKFSNLINSSRNLKSDIKDGLLECVEEFKSLINSQNNVIIEQKSHISNVLQTQVDRHFNATQALSQQIEEIKQMIGNKSYSTAVKTSLSSKEDSQPKNLIIIKPKDNNKKSFETEKMAKSIVNKNNCNIRVKNARKISKGGITIECQTSEECEQVIKLISDKSEDLTAAKPAKRAPKIVIYGVPEEMSEKEIIDEIVDNNNDIKDYLDSINSDNIEQEISVKFKFRQRRKNYFNNWVLQVSPNLHKVLMNKRSILIGWKSCSFANYISIIRCYKCNGFSHIAKDCKQQFESCGHCGQSHKTKECDQLHNLFCNNCDKHNKSSKTTIFKPFATNHSSYSNQCESLLRIKSIIEAKTSYE